MSAHKMRQSGLILFLHLYTEKTCIRKNIIFFQGERHKICLSKESLQTVFSFELLLYQEGEAYKLNGIRAYEDNPCILRTEAEEEIVAVISKRNKLLLPCEKLVLAEKMEIRIGSSFQNEIFYDCASFIKDRHIRIYKEGTCFCLESCVGKTYEREEAVYLNGQAVHGKIVLSKGDEIVLLGLTLIYLPELLVCCSHYGILRAVQGYDRIAAWGLQGREGLESRTEQAGNPKEEIRQSVIEDKKLIVKELEIELPEREKAQQNQPLLLTLGPSVTMVIPMMLMAVLGSAMLGTSGAAYYKISVVMTAASAFLSVFWGLINHFYKKKISEREKNKKKAAYTEYLNRTQQYLSESLLYNQEVLLARYPACKSFLPKPQEAGRIFWGRSIWQRDYLFIRLGLGEMPFQIKLKLQGKSRELNGDRLAMRAYHLSTQFQELKQVPLGIDLRKQQLTGFVGNDIYPVFLQAMIQLAAFHSSKDMKLVYFFHEEKEEEKRIADSIKWLPHIWKNGRKVRYLAGNEREAGELLPELLRELQDRKEKKSTGQAVYVFILAARELIHSEGLYRLLLEAKESSGIYTLFLSKTREEIPGECQCLVIREKDREEIAYYEQETVERKQLRLEESSFYDAERFSRKLSEMPFVHEEQEEGIREKVSFLELYSCENVEELNCPGRWRIGQTGERIRVPIGIGTGRRLIYLDVHEKFHGPHGLIAGTTGSGKSELLQTYLLSLAVSFSPEDINFFIIDYKGGGMGNMLKSLPHCAGVVSNLSGRQVKRALVSIKSENFRRQKLLSGAGVNNVTDYTTLYKEGKVQEPVPQLILVVDEFAELKREEPEFMQEIISVAQVGRSLGIHLILSTQKPAGTVDDKIWSNTRFRLCLRVAEKQDSMDMLHRPEAAYLTGAGQCYLQVGNNELYELFQTGYAGAEYEEKGSLKEGAYMVSNTGRRFALSRKGKQFISQLEAVSGYVNRAAKSLHYSKAKSLWMPELSDRISLEDMKPDQGEIALQLGICDDPERQRQYVLDYNPLQEGNLLLCAAPTMGKSTFLQTMLFQLCQYPPKEVQFMLAASNNAGVNCFENMPGCLGVMKRKEDAQCFFFHVERILTERKEKLGGVNFLQYRKHQSDREAILFLIIDNYGSFRQATQDRYEELIERVAGEGLNYGIYLMITALNVSAGEIPGKLFEKLKVALTLEMSDRFQYGDVLRNYHINVLPKENVKGRGLCKKEGKILEFQVPLFLAEEDDYERIHEILAFAEKRNRELAGGELPEKFPCIPLKPTLNTVLADFQKRNKNKNAVPLGYEQKSGYIAELPIRENLSFLISGAEESGKKTLLCCLIHCLWEKQIQIILFDRKKTVAEMIRKAAFGTGNETRFLHLQSKEEFIAWYMKDRENVQRKEQEEFVFCIGDLTDFSAMLLLREEKILRIREEMSQLAEDERMIPLIALCRPGREMEASGTPVFSYMAGKQWGIHLGGNAANQRILSFDDLSYTQANQWEMPGTGYLRRGYGSKTEKICLPAYGGEKENDTFGYTGSCN